MHPQTVSFLASVSYAALNAITAIISSTSILKLLFARLSSKLAACLAAGRHGIAVGIAAMAS
jgi:hypothetical protein